jgi:3-phosphoshikimate 1-carboxyvinyltransferase
LADGVTEIRDCLLGEDVRSTMGAFRAMGVEIEELEEGRLIRVHGRGVNGLKAPTHDLDMGNSGTSIRLLSGILAGHGIAATLSGDASLQRRPMRRVTDPLGQMGAVIHTGEKGTPPLRIEPGHPLHGIRFEMPVASAQVKSAVLLAGLFAEGETTVIEPAPTRDHTERMLATFGAHVETGVLSDGRNWAAVEGGARLQGCAVRVPADPSSAAFAAAAALIRPGSEILIDQVCLNPLRAGCTPGLGNRRAAAAIGEADQVEALGAGLERGDGEPLGEGRAEDGGEEAKHHGAVAVRQDAEPTVVADQYG